MGETEPDRHGPRGIEADVKPSDHAAEDIDGHGDRCECADRKPCDFAGLAVVGEDRVQVEYPMNPVLMVTSHDRGTRLQHETLAHASLLPQS